MRITRLGPLFALGLLLSLTLVEAQQSAPATTPTRDPQALTILTQCLQAAGGTQAISAIQDFTASGTITYYSAGEQVQGTVTVKGRGFGQFRMDASFPDGVRSWIVSKHSAFEKNPDGSTSSLPSQNAVKPASATFPLLYLVSVLQDTSISVSNSGLVTHNGNRMYDIVVQKVLSKSVDPLNAVGDTTKEHFFIDPNSLVIQSVQDMAYRKDGGLGASAHEIQFSTYQTVSGVSVPLSITEFIADRKTATIQLNQVSFNNGLTDSDFE